MISSIKLQLSLSLVLALALSASALGQEVRAEIICKDKAVPSGYKIVGETTSETCPAGKGWLIKKQLARPRAVVMFEPQGINVGGGRLDQVPIKADSGACLVNGGVPLTSVESDIANIKMSISLGCDGNEIRCLELLETKITADLYTPEAFSFPSASKKIELLPDISRPARQIGEMHRLIDGTFVPPYTVRPLRQLKVPESLVDIIVITQWEYELRFYHPQDIGPKLNGLYTMSNSPFVVYRFKNPNPPAINRLQISKIKSGREDTSEYFYNDEQDTWLLKENGREVSSKQSIINPQDPCERIETRIDKREGKVIKTIKVFRGFPWGQELVKQINDPDNQALTTTYAYDDDPKSSHYNHVKSIIHPDGTVERWP